MIGDRQKAKQATRARISDVATALFTERGFDRVTVSEIADAAGVSKVTVFAHFPRKEDLFLDRGPEAVDLVTGAVRARPQGTSAALAVRQLAEQLARERHPLSGVNDSAPAFLAIVAGSPALLDRARQLCDEVEAALATELRRQTEPAPFPELTAALIVSAYRVVLTGTARSVLAGASGAVVRRRHRAALAAAFDAVESALASLSWVG